VTLTVLTGLLAGAFHVLSGPDHLAAVAPLALSSEGRHAWREGWRWGLGHTAGVIVVALVALALRGLLPQMTPLAASVAMLMASSKRASALAAAGGSATRGKCCANPSHSAGVSRLIASRWSTSTGWPLACARQRCNSAAANMMVG